jgi:hypothetical protein
MTQAVDHVQEYDKSVILLIRSRLSPLTFADVSQYGMPSYTR